MDAAEQLKAERELIRRVFRTDEGQKLLRKWKDQHVTGPIFDQHNHDKTIYRVAHCEFVTNIINILETSDE